MLPPDLLDLIAAGYIQRQRHPTADLYLHNYTNKTQYESHWTEWTRRCRGLILNGQDEVVARPFEKFFNLEELGPNPELPPGPYEVFEKLDGSLGILYWTDDGRAAIATRGSFMGEQARRATAILREKYADRLPGLDRSLTYLFEVIYPENRIVLDYAGREELVLLAVVDTATGQEPAMLPDVGFPRARAIATGTAATPADLFALRVRLDRAEEEGLVVRWQSGLRVKLKFAEYSRLHRILSQVSTINLWEYLATGQPLDPWLDRVPDELYRWVQTTVAELRAHYAAIEADCRAALVAATAAGPFPDRRAAAAFIQTQPYPGVLYRMLDNRPYDELIWKLTRPEFAVPGGAGAAEAG